MCCVKCGGVKGRTIIHSGGRRKNERTIETRKHFRTSNSTYITHDIFASKGVRFPRSQLVKWVGFGPDRINEDGGGGDVCD